MISIDYDFLCSKENGDLTKEFNEPRVDLNVKPCQKCKFFAPRQSAYATKKECWYCKYAEFSIDSEKPLKSGLCCWPNIRNK